MQSTVLVLDYAPPLRRLQRRGVQWLLAVTFAAVVGTVFWHSRPKPPAPVLVPLQLTLPKPIFVSTPRPAPPATRVPNFEGFPVYPRPPFMVPQGCVNLAMNKPVTLSDPTPILGDASLVTDGTKEGVDGNCVELGPGSQWVQIDLQQPVRIYAIASWQYWLDTRVYFDVSVQVSNDPQFQKGVTTLYNNDHDNSSGLGFGKNKTYFETNQGRIFDGRGVVARYVRLYSNGSSSDNQNHWTEVEVHGLPAAAPVPRLMKVLTPIAAGR